MAISGTSAALNSISVTKNNLTSLLFTDILHRNLKIPDFD